jgi:hypothetical protein
MLLPAAATLLLVNLGTVAETPSSLSQLSRDIRRLSRSTYHYREEVPPRDVFARVLKQSDRMTLEQKKEFFYFLWSEF